jgi:hypothetical protein
MSTAGHEASSSLIRFERVRARQPVAHVTGNTVEIRVACVTMDKTVKAFFTV